MAGAQAAWKSWICPALAQAGTQFGGYTCSVARKRISDLARSEQGIMLELASWILVS
jgi:hypothetical protein